MSSNEYFDDLSIVNRRKFLTGLSAAIATAGVLSPISAFAARQPLAATRSLAFRSVHTGESVNAVYVRNHQINPVGLDNINYLLRDWRNDKRMDMSLELLDMLSALQERMGTEAPFEVISAYRSPETNKMLRARSSGVAKNSLHIQGKAIDIRLPNRDLSALHKGALSLNAGGVGLYSRSGFVHIDTGRVRNWGS